MGNNIIFEFFLENRKSKFLFLLEFFPHGTEKLKLIIDKIIIKNSKVA